jgi:uncharacterized protein YebE (UPF0316 family)
MFERLRTPILWISGLIGTATVVAEIYNLVAYAVGYPSGNLEVGFTIGVGAALLFVCSRLWATEKDIN